MTEKQEIIERIKKLEIELNCTSPIPLSRDEDIEVLLVRLDVLEKRYRGKIKENIKKGENVVWKKLY